MRKEMAEYMTVGNYRNNNKKKLQKKLQ